MLREFKQTNGIAHLQKLANQSTLNKAHVIEITKVCTVALMKAKDSLVVRFKEKHVNWQKKAGAKARKVVQVRQYFVNPKTETEVFG